MTHLLSSPSFWYAISFLCFVALTFRKISSSISLKVRNHIEEVTQTYKEAQSLEKEAKKKLLAIEQEQHDWPPKATSQRHSAQEALTQKQQQLEQSFLTSKQKRLTTLSNHKRLLEDNARQAMKKKLIDIALEDLEIEK